MGIYHNGYRGHIGAYVGIIMENKMETAIV